MLNQSIENIDFTKKRPYRLPKWRRVLLRLLSYVKTYWKDDKSYLTVYYLIRLGKFINWRNPKTFTEKLNWLKIHNRKDEYPRMVDKLQAKEFAAEKISDEYIIPTLGVWNSFDEIDFSRLPNRFVLKTTHGGGNSGVVVCKDKRSFDISKAREKLNKSMLTDIYVNMREWPYKNIERKIIAEEYVEDKKGKQDDYKIFCFNGKVKFFKVVFNNNDGHHANFYNRQWELQPFYEADVLPDPQADIIIPDNFDKMIEIAEKLSEGIPFLRVDLYNLDSKIFFGETTFYPAGGWDFYAPGGADEYIGALMDLGIKGE